MRLDAHEKDPRTHRHSRCRSSRSAAPRKSWMSASLRPQGPNVGVFLLVGLEWLTSLAVAQNRQPNSQTGIQEPMRTASALRVDRPPRLDGTLNDPLWQQATPTNSFLQREPFEGQAPTEKTEVRIVYDRHDASLSPRTRPNTTKIDSP